MIIRSYDLDSLPPLHRAAGAGDVDELARRLDAGADVDARADARLGFRHATKRGLTPLMVAAGSPHATAAAIRALLKHGANPRAISGAGVNALWYAADAGDPEWVAALLTIGGDPHAVSSDGRSVVAVAARTGSAETLRLLLARSESGCAHAGRSHRATSLPRTSRSWSGRSHQPTRRRTTLRIMLCFLLHFLWRKPQPVGGSCGV
jgi:ankyrin repeat protein